MRFNKIVSKFGDDLKKPEYKKQRSQIIATSGFLVKQHIAFRLDGSPPIPRSWEYSHLMQKIGVRKKIILDFGGGNSIFSYHLVLKGHRVFMVDINTHAVNMFNENMKRLKLGRTGKAVRYDGTVLPFPDEYFDMIISVSVIEHIPKRQRKKIFSELKRVLRKGKNLLITFDYGEDAKLWGTPFTSIDEVYEGIVDSSGLELDGDDISEPQFDKDLGPPVKKVVPIDKEYMDVKVIQYTCGALCLKKT